MLQLHKFLIWKISICVILAAPQSLGYGQVRAEPREAEMAGYLLVPHERVDEKYDGGFSVYVTAWPLLKNYPGRRFQTGLFGTWMFAQSDSPRSMETYSDIEGGLGWWRDTRFATETPKFIMGGVAKSFSEWANGPGAGKGRDWSKPNGKYGVAQLSQHVVWPPDGLNLKQGTSGELFGYGYLPLPLADAKETTAGQQVPTGDQCWTLFLNTGNFKGPVAFFTPHFWTKPSLKDASLAGQFLDSRPANPNKAIQMETQYIPAFQAEDANGLTYARIAPTSFPSDQAGNSPVVHRVVAYQKNALWDAVQSWFDGGVPASGQVDSEASVVQAFEPRGGSTWRLYPQGTPKEQKIAIDWTGFATPINLDSSTYGYRWNQDLVTQTKTSDGTLTQLPEYFRLTKNDKGDQQWVAIPPSDVPLETGLANVQFPRSVDLSAEPYVTPEDPTSSWQTPGPAAGPFQAQLGDGSVLTYSWYRFADQPALLNADLTPEERAEMQRKVEMIHRSWTQDGEYLPPPTRGELADLDPALLVTPPQGLEIGFVPIATRQERAASEE
ncbi:hypothetical protein [Aureliella helgolandensis]|uniref:Uncharacterized protein n=1 Tax=Aureliella helgolandensis TaxID=2527968 RepID=A0A518G431_9BACT|nr:hypothetical protein [Aureliella helgolandensis]QDV23353.1 hypothetical protein Q31a_16510 [Aureliella helgolandensis]